MAGDNELTCGGSKVNWTKICLPKKIRALAFSILKSLRGREVSYGSGRKGHHRDLNISSVTSAHLDSYIYIYMESYPENNTTKQSARHNCMEVERKWGILGLLGI